MIEELIGGMYGSADDFIQELMARNQLPAAGHPLNRMTVDDVQQAVYPDARLSDSPEAMEAMRSRDMFTPLLDQMPPDQLIGTLMRMHARRRR